VDLTKRQSEIFEFIRRYAGKYGYPPTVREIGKAVGLHSSKPRAVELLVDKARKALRGPGLPLVGAVSAGEPILAEENIEEYVEVPPTIGGEDADYVLRVKGESMKDAGIIDGDFVVVQSSPEARNGEIVVALLGEEATVKRFFRERNHIRLQPENKSMKPIRSADVEVLGKVVGVFRKV
jgi:repressor LexA